MSILYRSSGGRPSFDVRGVVPRPVVGAALLLGVLELARFLAGPNPVDLAALVMVAAIGALSVRDRVVDCGVTTERYGEAATFARILSGLSRSVSPDAIVATIMEELGAGTGADYVAVVRRCPETKNLEAIVSPTRPGAPTSRTTLPLRELGDPAIDRALTDLAVAAARGRRLTAVPIQPDAGGDPQLARLGLVRRPGLTLAVTVAAGDAAPRADRGSSTIGPVRRAQDAEPAFEGADQRIADRIAGRLRDAYGLRNLLAEPLRVNGRIEGAIILSRRGRSAWPDGDRRLLAAAAVETSAALARVYSLRDAEVRATTDALTGLPNRRYFDEYVGLLARRRRSEDRVGVLMIDIDRFKALNDTFGHAIGDHVLREVAQAIGGAVREGDVPARFGGEEFAVLLRNPSPAVAVEVGERVRRAVGALDLRPMGVPGVSVSVGVAMAEDPDVPLDAVIADADQALYRAKRAGRDRVVAA